MDLSAAIHGKKPSFAELKILDPIQMLQQLLSGEITDWPQIQELGNLFQSTMFDQLSQAGLDLKSIIGLGGENVQQTQKNALALQKGELPPEDIAALFRTGAAQNLKSGMGFWNPAAGSANQLRNYGVGLTEANLKGADLVTSGVNAAQRWMQIAQGTLLPSSAYLYSPEWFANFKQQQEAARTANLQMKYNLEAAPDPQWADRAKMLASLLGSFAGPSGGQMGQYASGSYGALPGVAGGAAVGSMGGPSGAMVGGMGGGLGFNQQTPAQNPGFLTNFSQSYQSTDPNNTGRGVGGWLGNVLGGYFNQG